ncbi:hypothetical protein [Nocardia arizonensis]|uniref:hypothetical protein n=1 Tax=Nocardia arizonensis TaxID=1141647 RepID=UPI0006D26FFE|nr:hypothetical protein [Nocardia arizonensis]
MNIKKLVAATILTVAATGISAATASGSPAAAGGVSGADQGVEYSASVAPDRSSATVTLASGRFVVAPDDTISVVAPDGAVVATVPTSMRTITGQQVQVAPEVDPSATTLTLTPVSTAVQPEFIGDAGTTVAGVLIGCGLGFLVGLVFLVVGVIPGCVIGGLIGGVAGANQ